MTTRLAIKYSPSCNRVLSLLKRTLLTSLLIGLIWLPVLPLTSALAMPDVAAMTAEIASRVDSTSVDSISIESARMNALMACLPKQLSQPNLKRALSEMGDDQLERAFNLKSNPKLSEAEIELKSCMSRQGFTN
ncbi:MAG: hypothetical protein HC827_08015 [Cyanobacteria bacterium RM1_2_2]|nr:hypothetical protein [Cyanobacteria bacterium RM1_2_2]